MEVLLGFVIVILLSQKSYKPPKRPLTEQVLSNLIMIVHSGIVFEAFLIII